MRTIFILLLCVGAITIAIGQQTISKVVIDDATGRPVISAHIYVGSRLKNGTITNMDGRFVLKSVFNNNILEISHISYEPYKKAIIEIASDTIRLSKKSVTLNEIVIHAESGAAIMTRVIDSITVNHFVEPVMYRTYVRVLRYERDYSELHILSEYLMDVYQNEKSNSEFNILKIRAKPFSYAGRKYFKDMRMMHAISIQSDNIFKYKYALFKKKNLKKYNFEILEDSVDDAENLIKLRCIPKRKEEFYCIVLWITKSSYAVQKMIKYYSKSKEEFTEVYFKQIGNKWYLDYSKRKIYSDFFSKWQPDSKSVIERVVIYNVNTEQSYNNKIFKTAFNLVAEPIKYHSSNWLDEFWDDNNYIPLPEWIREKIDNSNSR